MVKFLLLFIPMFSFSDCHNSNILGIFPSLPYVTCTDTALIYGGMGLISAFLFWHQATK